MLKNSKKIYDRSLRAFGIGNVETAEQLIDRCYVNFGDSYRNDGKVFEYSMPPPWDEAKLVRIWEIDEFKKHISKMQKEEKENEKLVNETI